MRVRQSLLGSFDACPRRAQYSIEDQTYHSGIVRAVGTAYHAGLEYYYLKRQEGGGSPGAWYGGVMEDMAESALAGEIEKAGEAFVWDDKFPDYDTAKACLHHMLTRYFEDDHTWPVDWTVLGVEQYFELPFGDHVRTGTMDLVLQAPDGGILGVDHKTAGRKWDQYKHLPRKNSQSSFYVAALRELYPDAAYYRFVFDVMTYKGEFERRVSDPSIQHCQAVLDKALQVATLMDGMRGAGMDLPANPSSTLCSSKWCDWFAVCPHGAILDT